MNALEDPRVAVLVPAAGSGKRMGGVRKPFKTLGERSILAWAVAPFLERQDVVELVVALDPGADWPAVAAMDPRLRCVEGGASRFESVVNALEALQSDAAIVAVHDGARPFPPRETIEDCIRAAATGIGAVAGIPAVDTVKRAGPGDVVEATPPRSELWYAQTPQVFPRDLFAGAVAHCRSQGLEPTDDAAVVEQVGGTVRMIRSSPRNLKVTHPEDLLIARAYVEQGLV